MSCVKHRGRFLARAASGGSVIGLIFLPKCPLCLAMWLGTIGITSASAGQLHTVGAGLLAMLAGVCGWSFGAPLEI